MPTTNARKHTIPGGNDQSITRLTIFEMFGLSIRDVVPVANTTERSQLVTDLTAKGQSPDPTRPLVVLRADAPGLHRIEYTTNGTVWLPASGTLQFTNKAAADSFGTANGGLLSINDECVAGGVSYFWSGTDWNRDTAWAALTLTNSWVNFGAPYRNASFKRENGWVHLRGSVKSGASGPGNPIATLPSGFRPVGGDEQFVAIANVGVADLRVDTAGLVYIAGYLAGGNNGVISLSQVRFSI